MPEVEPAEAVRDILKALREGRLEWIAEEIESTILGGKITPEGQKDLSKEPFTDIEQLSLVLRTIQHYSIGIEKVFSKSIAFLKEACGLNDLQISIKDVATGECVALFSQDFHKGCDSIDTLLRQAWPESSNFYDQNQNADQMET